MLLTNGRVYLMDAWDTLVDTLVVRDGRVAFAGRRADVTSPAAKRSSISAGARWCRGSSTRTGISCTWRARD